MEIGRASCRERVKISVVAGSSRRRHTRWTGDWSSDVCSSDLVGDAKYGELLGGHIVGAKATELIQELVNAKALEGGFPEVARMIHGHPTLSEAVMEAARAADGDRKSVV